MTNELIASALCFNLYRDCLDRDQLIHHLRAESMLSPDDPTDDATLCAAIDTDIRDALHNANLDFFIPRAMIDDDRFDPDYMILALDDAFDFLRDHFDPRLILAAILDRRP